MQSHLLPYYPTPCHIGPRRKFNPRVFLDLEEDRDCPKWFQGNPLRCCGPIANFSPRLGRFSGRKRENSSQPFGSEPRSVPLERDLFLFALRRIRPSAARKPQPILRQIRANALAVSAPLLPLPPCPKTRGKKEPASGALLPTGETAGKTPVAPWDWFCPVSLRLQCKLFDRIVTSR